MNHPAELAGVDAERLFLTVYWFGAMLLVGFGPALIVACDSSTRTVTQRIRYMCLVFAAITGFGLIPLLGWTFGYAQTWYYLAAFRQVDTFSGWAVNVLVLFAASTPILAALIAIRVYKRPAKFGYVTGWFFMTNRDWVPTDEARYVRQVRKTRNIRVSPRYVYNGPYSIAPIRDDYLTDVMR